VCVFGAVNLNTGQVIPGCCAVDQSRSESPHKLAFEGNAIAAES
jgi:hypothetical protein